MDAIDIFSHPISILSQVSSIVITTVEEITMDMLDQMNLHLIMQERLEKILEDIERNPKGKSKKTKGFDRIPANKERAEWNLQEIPVLFGA